MNTAKVFRTGRSQAVRLPKECRFRTKEVLVNKVGESVILFPRGKGWEALVKSLEHFTDDFMADRNQPRQADRRKPL